MGVFIKMAGEEKIYTKKESQNYHVIDTGKNVYLGVVAIEKGAFGSPSTKVANFTYIYIYIYIYIYKFCYQGFTVSSVKSKQWNPATLFSFKVCFMQKSSIF